jgi:hypothetical protein
MEYLPHINYNNKGYANFITMQQKQPLAATGANVDYYRGVKSGLISLKTYRWDNRM